MPDSTTESASASAAAANHNDDAGDAAAGVSGEQNKKRHNSGAADLEKVTDYAEEKEILSTSTDLDDAIAVIRARQIKETAEKLAREKELAKVAIRNEDVDLIAHEMEISKTKAEKTLREHGGNVVSALASLTN